VTTDQRSFVRILALDIETRPTEAYVWRPYKENVGVDQVIRPGGVLTWAAKWYGEKAKIEFEADWTLGHDNMIGRAWELLDEADAVLHYNGRRFDIPHLQREFMQLGLTPPSPYRQIDLLETVKKQAKFFMNRLAHVAPELGLRGKIEHEGFPLWIKCLEGDEDAQRRMERYNKRDVTELIELYDVIRPWITAHTSHAAHAGEEVCPKCGSAKLQWRGYAMTAQTKYRKFQCQDCGGWGRSTLAKKEDRVHVVQVLNS
jgi:predicted RNA-binding Zn-ribbon protein involved in translation (DUF1610 family)